MQPQPSLDLRVLCAAAGEGQLQAERGLQEGPCQAQEGKEAYCTQAQEGVQAVSASLIKQQASALEMQLCLCWHRTWCPCVKATQGQVYPTAASGTVRLPTAWPW